MNSQTRNDLASSIGALGLVSFGINLWLFYAYYSSHPKQPDVGHGFTHPLNNHGSYVYLTDTEATGLYLLLLAFLISILLAGLIRHGGSDPASTSPRMKIIFACSLVIYTLVICLAGPSIANFAVSHGIVLN
jgi:hypothetical protein